MKQYECRDCALGEESGPCTAPFENKDFPPTECPYQNGTDCNWVLIEVEKVGK
jgi:hypothetical protein